MITEEYFPSRLNAETKFDNAPNLINKIRDGEISLNEAKD